MRLLIYSHFFAPSVGGVEALVLSLARGLADLRRTSSEAEFEVALVTQTAANGFDDSALPFRVIRRPGRIHLWKLIRAADAVHIANPALLPLFLARVCRKPVVIEHHGYQAVCPNGLLLRQPDGSVCPCHFLAGEYAQCLRCLSDETPFWNSYLRVLFMFPRHSFAKRAAANIAISNHFVARCALPRSHVIYHGIEPAEAPLLAPKPARNGPIRFACIGRLVREKGMPVAIEAMGLLGEEAPAELLLIGDGPERANLESLVLRKNLAGRVRITGFLTGSDFAAAVNTIEVVLMPSVWEETAGLAVMEHMMRGKLVIASDIGGLGEMVGDAGIKFTAGDSKSLAEAMRTVVRNPALITAFGEKARARARMLFGRNRMITEHAELYRRLRVDGH